ncbi:MAG TPA: NAD(P)-dependent oxidoreductase [Gemmatimonadales bacterium]|nr:NAD(P)-dependent oxidoreductase [Gemmatimonadales bacterium]
MRVSFLGLGAIGRPMAARLAGPYELTVWNRSAERAQAFAREHRARVADSPREAAAGAQAVITCLPTSADVASLLDGDDGLLAGLEPGAILLDCTSGDPATSRRIAERLQAAGVAFADAPVSGGTNGAAAGTLTVMVGSDDVTFNRAREIVRPFAGRVEHMGPVGTGHAMKAVNNALLAVHIAAAGEGLATLVKAGVPAAKALDVLNASSGRSFVSEQLIPERVLTGAWPRTFRLALLDKDTGIALALADELGVEAPVMSVTGDVLAVAGGVLGPDADYLEVIRVVESQAGVEIRG